MTQKLMLFPLPKGVSVKIIFVYYRPPLVISGIYQYYDHARGMLMLLLLVCGNNQHRKGSKSSVAFYSRALSYD